MPAEDHLSPNQFTHEDVVRDVPKFRPGWVYDDMHEDQRYTLESVAIHDIKQDREGKTSLVRDFEPSAHVMSKMQQSPGTMPPIVVVDRGSHMEFADGDNRVNSAARLGMTHLPAYVRRP